MRPTAILMAALAASLGLVGSATAMGLSLPHPPALTAGARNAQEAKAIEKEVWGKVLVRCGHNLVYARDDDGHAPQVFKKVNFNFDSTTGDLSPADRANGVEWQGEFYINSPLYRTYISDPAVPQGHSLAGHWGTWQDNYADSAQAGFRIRKFRGQWQIADITRSDQGYAALDPGGLKSLNVSCATPDEPAMTR
jgi:hypothetical protein